MSTKVYDGYVFEESLNFNFNDFFKQFNKLKEKISKKHKMAILKTFFETYNDANTSIKDIDIPYFLYESLYSKRTSLIVFPQKGDKTYCMIFGDADDTKIIQEEFNIKEFCYFNNTDRPEQFSEEEWKERDLIWSEVLGRDYKLNPNEAGLTFSINTSIHHVTKSDFEEFKRTVNFDKLKLNYFKTQFFNNHPEKERISIVMEDYEALSDEFKQVEANKMEIKWNLDFPTSIENKSGFSKLYDLENNLSLNDVVLKMNDAFEKRLLKLNSIFKNRFPNNDIEVYIDSTNRDNTAEIIKLIDDNDHFEIGIEVLKCPKLVAHFNSEVNIFKEINMDQAIINHFFNIN